jgi:hypothetical protein
VSGVAAWRRGKNVMRSDVNGKRRRRRTNEPKVNARMDGCRGEKKEKKSALSIVYLKRNSQGRIWQQQTLMNSRSLIKTNKHTHTCVCTLAAN